MYEGRLRELANIEKLQLAESIQLQEATAQNLETVYEKWLDDAKGTPEDLDAARSRLVATGKHARPRGCDAGDTSRSIASQAATKTNAKGQHDCLIASHGVRAGVFHAKGSSHINNVLQFIFFVKKKKTRYRSVCMRLLKLGPVQMRSGGNSETCGPENERAS